MSAEERPSPRGRRGKRGPPPAAREEEAARARSGPLVRTPSAPRAPAAPAASADLSFFFFLSIFRVSSLLSQPSAGDAPRLAA